MTIELSMLKSSQKLKAKRGFCLRIWPPAVRPDFMKENISKLIFPSRNYLLSREAIGFLSTLFLRENGARQRQLAPGMWNQKQTAPTLRNTNSICRFGCRLVA